MKAVILSGGKGTRVRPLTYDLPKPLVPVVEKPIIGYLFDLLKLHDFTDVIVTVSYKADMLQANCSTGHTRGMHIAYSLEGRIENGEIISEALGSAGGLKRVQAYADFFDEPFLVVCGDAIIDLDLTEAMAFHKQHGGMATVVCKEVPKEEVSSYGVVVMDANQKIESFQEKPRVEEAKSNCVNTGIYIFNPEILDLIPQEGAYDIGGELLPSLVEKEIPFYAHIPDFKWIDVGTSPDFYRANMRVMQGEVPSLRIPGREVREGIFMGINCQVDLDKVTLTPPVYIGNSVKIADGVVVEGPAVLESGVVLEEGVKLEQCVVLNHTKIGAEQHFIADVINSRYVINQTGEYVTLDDEGHTLNISDSRE